MEQSHLYLHKFYAQISPGPLIVSATGLHPQSRPATQQPEHIDELVALELQHLKTHYADEEQRYVDQMLLANPIVVERRAQPRPETTASGAPSPTEASRTVPAPTPSPRATSAAAPMASSRHDTQRQRAESCRKSRYNNKIKKAKLRFRHKFVSSQLTESAGVLDHMREVIAQAEAELLARGFNMGALERMRRNFGVDRCMTTAMDQ
ncbi:protein sisterless A [Drosophila persimilis]|uniref:protein sisterless A n=1 Tax=Drosophila persimilis TaxID=7234 RepID=UPI000F0753E8|nr:protein sisterless A [Drosophila persimilis]